MPNTTFCAGREEILYLGNVNFLISQIIDLLAILLTFLVTYKAANFVLKKSIFTITTKILLLQNLAYANIHQVFYGIEAIELLYKAIFLLDHPCDLLQSEAHCACYLEVMLAGGAGMIYGHTALMLERLFATFIKSYEKPKSYIIEAFLSIALFISSAVTGRLLLWDDPLKEYVIACFVFPSQSFGRANWYFTVCTVLTLFNFVVSLWILRYNRCAEFKSRFKVKERFQKREVIDSTEMICFLMLVEFLFMLIYSVGVMMLLNAYRNKTMTPADFGFWIVWCYTVPFAACVYPLVLIHRIQAFRNIRAKKLESITKSKQTQEGHINQMKDLWA